MTLKNGLNLEWVKNHTYQEKSLKWYRTSTASIKSTRIIYLAPAPPKQ